MTPNENTADGTETQPVPRKQLPEIVEARPCANMTGRARCWCILKRSRALAEMWSAQSRAARIARDAGAHQPPGLDFALIMICVGVLLVAVLSVAGVL